MVPERLSTTTTTKYEEERDGVEKQIDEIRNGISDIEFQREIKDMVKISQSFEKYKSQHDKG